jgi:hypothetical protein
LPAWWLRNLSKEKSPEKKQWEERMMDKTAIKVLADNSYQD